MFTPSRYFGFAATFTSFGVLVLLVAEAARRSPINHVGYDPRWLIPPCVLSIAMAVGVLRANTTPHMRKWYLAGVGMAFLSLIAVLLVDHCNLLIEYETWLRRGMPTAGCGF